MFYFLPHSRMEIIWFLLVGLVAGWIAGEIVRGHGFGVLGNIVVGLVGALIGGYLFSFLGINTYGVVGSVLMAVAGAVVLLLIVNAVRGARA